MPNKARKQHFVPKVYLRNFADRNENLYVYDMKGKRKSNIANEACERDFNEYQVHKDKTDGRYEDLFSKFESLAGPLTKKLLAGQELDYAESINWSLYLACLFIRTRKLRQDFAANAGGALLRESLSEQSLRTMQADLLKRGRLVDVADLRNIVAAQIAVYKANPAYLHLSGLEERLPRYAMLFVQRHWILAEDESASLITSDSPVCSAQILGTGSQ